MKKFITILMVGVLLCTLVGCSSIANGEKKSLAVSQDGVQKTIYTTFYPVYDLTARIVGDKMNVKMLIETTSGAHNFELKPSQIVNVSKADLIIFNGANMESFITDLKGVVKDDDKFVDLSENLTLLEADKGHKHLHDGDDKCCDEHHTDEHHSDKHSNVNPHTWLSLKNAITKCNTIYKKVSTLDAENQNYYKENLDKVVKELTELDERFSTEFSKIQKDEKYFVASHSAFDYLARDYGLKQVAVSGISPDKEPTAKQLKEIADFVKSHQITTIFFEGKSTPKVAETLSRETGVKTGTLYTLENLSTEQAKLGYGELMKQNLEALVESFNE